MSWRPLVVLTALSLVLAGCAAAPDDGSCDGREPGPPIDPATVTTAADGLDIEVRDGAAVVTVAQPFPGGAPQTVVLVRCGGETDPDLGPELADAPRIATPATLYSASTTHLPMLADIDETDALAAIADDSIVVDPDVRAAAAAGEIDVVGRGGTLDAEALLTAGEDAPDVVVSGGIDDPAYATVAAAGIPTVPGAEWLEGSPLGRAEWIKLFGLLTGAETRATQVYDRIAADYGAARDRVADAPPVPVVAGQLAAGAFQAPSGGSYVGALLRDAGADYPWADTPDAGTLSLPLEDVLTRAGDAPVWLTTATEWTTREDARRADPRHGLLAAMGPGGQAWTATRTRTPEGGNDWFERGVTRPDLVLGDLAAILHPDRFPGHEFTFYRPLEGP